MLRTGFNSADINLFQSHTVKLHYLKLSFYIYFIYLSIDTKISNAQIKCYSSSNECYFLHLKLRDILKKRNPKKSPKNVLDFKIDLFGYYVYRLLKITKTEFLAMFLNFSKKRILKLILQYDS